MVNDVKAGRFVEGGSTITQQLAKNLYFTQEKKMERKVAEVFMAFALERDYSKNEILELYVNTIISETDITASKMPAKAISEKSRKT